MGGQRAARQRRHNGRPARCRAPTAPTAWNGSRSAPPRRSGRGFLPSARQGAVIGPVKLLQPRIGFAAFRACRDRSRPRRARCAESRPGRPPRAGWAHPPARPGRRRTCRHPVRLLLRFTSRKARGNCAASKRRAQPHDAGEQLVDKGVLGAAQGGGIQPGARQQAVGIAAPRMGRGEDKGHASGAPGAPGGTGRDRWAGTGGRPSAVKSRDRSRVALARGLARRPRARASAGRPHQCPVNHSLQLCPV